MKKIIQMKMSSGEEIICTLKGQDEKNYFVSDAFEIKKLETKNNEIYHAMSSWMMFQSEESDNQQNISKFHVIGGCDPHKTLLNQYTKTLDYLRDNKNPDIDMFDSPQIYH